MAPAIRNAGVLLMLFTITVQPACNRGRPGNSSDQQLQHFEGVIEHSGQTTDTAKSNLYVRASRRLEAGDIKSAEALYYDAIAKYPQDADGYEALGACLYFEEKYDDAEAEYARALELNGQSVDALYGLGCVSHKQKRYDEAKEYFEKALSLDENNGDCHRVLAIVYDEIDDKAKAVFHYERAISLDRSIADDAATMQRLWELKQ